MKASLKPAKAKPSPRPEKARGEALCSTADLMRETGYSRHGIQDLRTLGIIHQYPGGKWPTLRTLGTMVRKLREKDAGNEDRQRKNKAEADSAESRAMDDLGATVPVSAATLYVSEFRIATRQVIEREPTLTPKQKVTVQTKLAAIRIPPPKREP